MSINSNRYNLGALRDSETLVDDQVQMYRRSRRQKMQERRGRLNHCRSESAEMVQFARIWAPYGGAPDEETFQKFGMSRTRFVEKLWQNVNDTGYDARIVDQLAAVYPTQDPLID